MNQRFHSHAFVSIAVLSLIFGVLSSPAIASIKADDLRQQVLGFVDQQLKNDDSNHRLEIDIAQLDSRLKLSDCSKKLNFRLHGQKTSQGRLLVKTSCHGDKPWSIFITAHVKRFIPVATSKYPLKRGHKISATDLVLEERDISKLRNNYYTSLAELTGLIVRRTLPEQTALQSHQINSYHFDIPWLNYINQDQ